MRSTMTKVACPTCKNDVVWSTKSPYRPFCSKRCQLIDLGEWAEESNVISTPIKPQDDMTPDMVEDIEAMLAANQNDFFKE